LSRGQVEFGEEAVVVVGVVAVVLVVERGIDIARHWCGVALSLSLLIVDGGWQPLPSASAIVTYATDSPQYNVFFWKNVFD